MIPTKAAVITIRIIARLEQSPSSFKFREKYRQAKKNPTTIPKETASGLILLIIFYLPPSGQRGAGDSKSQRDPKCPFIPKRFGFSEKENYSERKEN